MKRFVVIGSLCLLAFGVWLFLRKNVQEPMPQPPASPKMANSSVDDTVSIGLARRPKRAPQFEQEANGTSAHSQSGDDTDVKTLLDTARSQNRIAEFGAELALDGSRQAVATLLKAIDLVEGEEKSQLARSLQALHSAEASAELQEFMAQNATNAVVAVQARDALARIVTGLDVTRMSQSLPSDPEQGLVRSYLLGTLARVRNADAVPQLAELCASQDPAIYTAAAIALGSIGSPEAVASLVKLIEERPVTDVNDPVVQALLSVGNKDAQVSLQDVYNNTTNPVVKYATAEALVALQTSVE
jgi:hypothetical protein